MTLKQLFVKTWFFRASICMTKKLEEMLEVPIVSTVALTGEGIKNLVEQINHATSPTKIKPTSEEARWIEIGHIIKQVEYVEHRHHSFRDIFSISVI